MTTLTIPERFNGPPGSGNGGYSAGRLAAALGEAIAAAAATAGGAGPGGSAAPAPTSADAVEVSLRAPVPIGRELSVELRDDGAVLLDGETVVAEARPAALEIDAPPPPSLAEAHAAIEHAPFLDPAAHPFPTCFVCGPGRPGGDGLGIFVGPVEGRDVFAAAWTPSPELAGPDGALPAELVWAALDCPTSGPVANDPSRGGAFLPIVLGRLTARVLAPVVAGEPHVVVAWPIEIDGRKRHAGAAIYTAGGELCGVSRALWIELRPSA